jgi:hypothetical protein
MKWGFRGIQTGFVNKGVVFFFCWTTSTALGLTMWLYEDEKKEKHTLVVA